MGVGLILGFFDGVHKGHRAVIESVQGDSVLVTFSASPAEYFNKTCEYIYSRKESLEKIYRLSVKEVVELDFAEFANMHARDYVQFLVDKFHPTTITTGFNHTFGLGKEGTPALLKKLQNEYNYIYNCVPAVVENGETVSSTLIKQLLKVGNITRANQLLESPFVLEGMVVQGEKLGRKIGFPTANINYPNNIVKIPYGAYCARVGRNKAVMNWGVKPTVNNSVKPVLEIHIIDFDENLYGKNIKIEVLEYLRPEMKFNSIEDLKLQINKDINSCLKL